MTRIVEGSIDIVVSRDKLLAAIDRSGGPRKEFTVEELADNICAAFCGPRKLRPTAPLAREIHRRQHIEIATAIFEAKGERQ